MNAILLSVKPKFLCDILNGKKTIEVRKSKLPLNVPVYLYCTKAKRRYSVGYSCFFSDELYKLPNGNIKFGSSVELMAYEEYTKDNFFNGKVVAKCVFTKVELIECFSDYYERFLKDICLSKNDFINYCNGQDLYFYTISNLEIFDKPKELGEFKHWTRRIIYSGTDCPPYVDEVLQSVYKAPQNFMYIEE